MHGSVSGLLIGGVEGFVAGDAEGLRTYCIKVLNHDINMFQPLDNNRVRCRWYLLVELVYFQDSEWLKEYTYCLDVECCANNYSIFSTSITELDSSSDGGDLLE